MPTTWIVAADSSRARILQVVGREHRLVEIQDFVNPKGRMDDRELITDAHPRFDGHGCALAQGYAHAILPLANERDRRTQVVWGIRDFEHRFGTRASSVEVPHALPLLEF